MLVSYAWGLHQGAVDTGYFHLDFKGYSPRPQGLRQDKATTEILQCSTRKYFKGEATAENLLRLTLSAAVDTASLYELQPVSIITEATSKEAIGMRPPGA